VVNYPIRFGAGLKEEESGECGLPISKRGFSLFISGRETLEGAKEGSTLLIESSSLFDARI